MQLLVCLGKSIVDNVRVLPKVALLQQKLIDKTKIYIMKNSNDETFNATFGNTMLCVRLISQTNLK